MSGKVKAAYKKYNDAREEHWQHLTEAERLEKAGDYERAEAARTAAEEAKARATLATDEYGAAMREKEQAAARLSELNRTHVRAEDAKEYRKEVEALEKVLAED